MSQRTYTPEMAVDLRIPIDVRMSPDGTRVAFGVHPIGHREKDPTSAIFVVAADGSDEPLPLTGSERHHTAPRWSPDGSRIAYLSDRDKRGTMQLHIVAVTGGEPLRLTDLDGGVGNATWFPDGKSLFVTARRKSLRGETESKSEVKVASEQSKPHAVARVSATGGTPVEIGPTHGHVWGFALSPDGSRLAAFISNENDRSDTYENLRLAIVSVEDGTSRDVAKFSGVPSDPRWSEDGRLIVCVGSQLPDIDPTNVFVIDADTGDVTVIDDRGMTPNWAAFDGDDLIVHSVETQRTRIDRTDTRGSEWEQLDLGPDVSQHWIESGTNIDSRNGRLAFTAARSNRPPDLYVVAPDETPVRLTDLNPQLDGITFAEMEPIEWQASDGTTVHGWLLLPPGADVARPLPLIAEIHGGPSTQRGNSFHGTWHDWAQVFTARGYAVFVPNARGSTGRGGAFTGANRFDFGGGDFDDILSGIDMLIERGVADANRLAICGWSFGGFMTAWAITHTDRFKAAIAGAAPTNWVSKIGTTDIRPFNEWNLGVVNTEPDKVWERSPIR